MPEACYKLRRVRQCICLSEASGGSHCQTGHQHCATRVVVWGVRSGEKFSWRSWLRDGSREGSAGLLPPPQHRGTRQGQSTFLAAEGEHKPKQWAQTGTCFGFPLNGSLIPLLLHFLLLRCLFPPVLLWGWQLLTETQHIPQPHSLRSSCVRLNDKIDVAICCRTYEIPLLPRSLL